VCKHTCWAGYQVEHVGELVSEMEKSDKDWLQTGRVLDQNNNM